MVILGCDAVGGEELTHLLGLLAVEGVDDCRPRYTAKDVQQFGSLVLGVAYHVGKVLAPETHAITVLLAEVELLLYVVDHLGCCRCGKRKQWHCGEDVAQFGYASVGRTEIVPPLRYTVRLVNGYQLHVDTPYFLEEELRAYSLGRYVEEFVVTEDTVLERGDNLARLHSGVYCQGLDATAAQVCHLILHEGNEWCDHNAKTLAGKRGHLEGDTLATTCRHKAEGISPSAYAFDYIALNATKIVIPPICLKDFAIFHQGDSLSCHLGVYALNLQLNLAMLVGVVLERVADIERLLGLDIFCLTALPECNTVENGV